METSAITKSLNVSWTSQVQQEVYIGCVHFEVDLDAEGRLTVADFGNGPTVLFENLRSCRKPPTQMRKTRLLFYFAS